MNSAVVVRPAGRAAGDVRAAPDVRRGLQLALAGIWLLDGVLQFQAFMFAKGFGQMLGESAAGNPGVIARPITWDATLVQHHAVALNAIFATVQLALGLGIAGRPTVRLALGASIAWSVAVWWFGEGLGMVLTGSPSPISGAPGAVILYALLAVLLWPADRGGPAPFTAARAIGAPAARALWLVLWLGLAYFALLPANRAPQALHDRRCCTCSPPSRRRGGRGPAVRARAPRARPPRCAGPGDREQPDRHGRDDGVHAGHHDLTRIRPWC